VVLLSATLVDADPTVLALATATGLLAALVQLLGLVRWPFVVPHLTRLAADPAASPATRDAVEVTFQPCTAPWGGRRRAPGLPVHRRLDRAGPGWRCSGRGCCTRGSGWSGWCWRRWLCWGRWSSQAATAL
jgi:hypothetical protein